MMAMILYIHAMETVFVFSDLHGDRHALADICERVHSEQADLILFAGDMGIDRLGGSRSLLGNCGVPIMSVRGNCDSSWAYSAAEMPLPPQFRHIPWYDRTLFLTHGHLLHWADGSPIALTERDIWISGHTHRSQISVRRGEPIMLNPGSAANPRDNRPPTYAVITHDCITISAVATGAVIESYLL